MEEEHGFQEGHRLCANNCGFFGSPATMDLCSKCYRDFHMKEDQASSAKSAVEKSLSGVVSAVESSSSSPSPSPPQLFLPVTAADVDAPSTDPAVAQPPPTTAQPNRCLSCRKRVGLTGFRCRCGSTFCGAHRYPEHHDCAFDFKKVGREAIARDNPVVKARKLEKI